MYIQASTLLIPIPTTVTMMKNASWIIEQGVQKCCGDFGPSRNHNRKMTAMGAKRVEQYMIAIADSGRSDIALRRGGRRGRRS